MVARNPIGSLGGLIILTSDKKRKKKPQKDCTLDYTQPGMHCTAPATTAMGLGPIARFSALRVTVLDGMGFDPRTFRSLGEISTATAAWVPEIQMLVPYIYLPNSSERT